MTLVVGAESRYDRQERVTWWEQSRLASARVLVAGAGALGNEIVKNLVMMGVGSILLVDFDTIDASNLARCVFFRDGDDGRRKVDVVSARAAELNPGVHVEPLHADLRSLGTGIAFRADVIVGALDNREARLYLNRLAWRAGKPWVDGAIEGLVGVARVFSPPVSCYECTLSEADFLALSHRQSCRLLSREEMASGRTPTTATSAAIVGGVQSQEVVKLLHRHREGVQILPGGVVADGLTNDYYPLRYPFSDDCMAHHVFVDPVRVAATDGLTFDDLARAVGFEDGVVELGDDHVVSWHCPTCGTEAAEARPVALVEFGDATCDQCGEPRQFDPVSSVAVPSDPAALPVARVGLRDDEVLAVRRGVEYRYVWLEQPNGLPSGWA